MPTLNRHRSSSDDFLFRPARAARAAITEFNRVAAQPYRLNWGIDEMDDYLIPMIGGDLVSVLGRPGMGKTTCLLHLCRQAVHVLARAKDPGVVLYATWETLVEETVGIMASGISGTDLSDLGRGIADLKRIEAAVIQQVGNNLAIFGRSRQPIESGTSRVHTLEDLELAIQELASTGTPVRLLVVDYLQRIPGLPGQDRTHRASENLERIKDLCLGYNLPTVQAVQSRRDVDEYGGLKMPGLNDGQWTSNIEQTSDKVFGVTMPWSYVDTSQPIIDGTTQEQYAVKPNTLCVKAVKQRWATSGAIFVLEVDWRGLSLSSQAPSPPAF